jgi:hypothetical protein
MQASITQETCCNKMAHTLADYSVGAERAETFNHVVWCFTLIPCRKAYALNSLYLENNLYLCHGFLRTEVHVFADLHHMCHVPAYVCICTIVASFVGFQRLIHATTTVARKFAQAHLWLRLAG